MKLIITANASQWLIQKFNLQAGDGVKFYGVTVKPKQVTHTPQQGYAPENDLQSAAINVHQDGINYHINLGDEWFFSGMTTTVDYDKTTDDLVFDFDNGTGNPDASTGASSRFEEYWE